MLKIRKCLLLGIFGLATTLAIGVPAQEPAVSVKTPAQTENATNEKAAATRDTPLAAYHLEFQVEEMEDGKKINSREYSTNLSTNEGNEIKIGTRVPVQTKEGEFQYLDVGTNIFARIGETRGQSELTVRAEISNFADEQSQDRHDLHPIIRQMKIGGSTLLPLGKTIVMGSADDPNSRRQFQLEVTVTKLR